MTTRSGHDSWVHGVHLVGAREHNRGTSRDGAPNGIDGATNGPARTSLSQYGPS